MMKKDTLTLLITTLLAGMLEINPVFAHTPVDAAGGCQHAYQHTRGAHLYRMGKRLGLSQNQRTAIRAIFEQHRPEMRALRDAQIDNRHALMMLSETGNADAAQIRALADKQGKTVANMIVLRARMRSEINKILTDEQRKKMLRGREHPNPSLENKPRGESVGMLPSGAAADHLSLLLQAHSDALL